MLSSDTNYFHHPQQGEELEFRVLSVRTRVVVRWVRDGYESGGDDGGSDETLFLTRTLVTSLW